MGADGATRRRRAARGGPLKLAPGAPVEAALRAAAVALRAAGVRDPEWDAELLLRHVLGWSRADVIARSAEPLAPDAAARFAGLLDRRAARVPLQHLTGVQAFWRHEFAVSPAVLIPRPETELLVEHGLRLLATAVAIVVDVGTGSGCLALSIAAERAQARVIGIDLSAAALAVARLNARRLGLEPRVEWLEGDLLAPVAELAGQLDLVVSNPPYVDPADPLEPEVRDHEPALALFPAGGSRQAQPDARALGGSVANGPSSAPEPPAGGSRDALSVYRRLWPQAATALRPGGWVLVEVGAGQAQAVAALAAAAGLDEVATFADLQGIPRVVQARRPR